MRFSRALIAEPVVVTGILLSTVALIAYGFTEPGTAAHDLWLAIDVLCVAYFALEVLLKMRVEGFRGYWERPWNRFDFVVVMLSMPVLLAPFTSETVAFVGVPILRLARLFRLFRLMRFIPDREHLGNGIIRAMRASIGVFLAIAVVNFIFAMGAHVLFDNDAPQYFGDPGRACYSMFRIFTIEGWNEIPDAIVENASYGWTVFVRVYFGAAVLFGGILGLSIGNAVFCDQMIADNTESVQAGVDELTGEVHQLRAEIRELKSLLVAATTVEPSRSAGGSA